MLRKRKVDVLKNQPKKSYYTKNNIPPTILKESHKVSFKFLQKLVSDTIISGCEPEISDLGR